MVLFLKPHFEIKPWAGRNMAKYFDCPEGTGEAWIVSGYKGKSSTIINGRYKNQTLRHLWQKHPELFGTFKEKEFPILIKLIDAGDNLSIQVHPDDDYALKKQNSLGKFECWYILGDTLSKTIIVGVDAKSKQELKGYIDSSFLEKKLLKRNIKNNDLVIIEPGTVHAIQKDTFLLEIQESSDITYRLYDYDRIPRRELHIVDSLNVIKYNDKHNPIHNFTEDDAYYNRYFDLEKITINGEREIDTCQFKICYIVEGDLSISDKEVSAGDIFLLTVDKQNTLLKGNAKVLLISPKIKEEERLKMRKVALITGITTQNGSYLAELLLKKNYEVHALITSISDKKRDNIQHLVNNSDVLNKLLFFHLGDLTDSSNLNRIIESIKPDEIYHLASQAYVTDSFEIPEYTTNVNAMGTLRLLDAIKQNELRTKIYCESSCLILDGSKQYIPQGLSTPFNPKTPFATSKMYAYFITKNYRDNYGIYAVNGISFNQTSLRESEDFIGGKILSCVKDISNGKREMFEVGNLDAQRDWGYARDYVEGIWLSLQQEKPDDYIFATGESHTVRQFINEAFKVHGITIEWIGCGAQEHAIDVKTNKVLVYVNPNLFKDDKNYYCGDAVDTKNKLKWEPTKSLEDNIKRMIGEN